MLIYCSFSKARFGQLYRVQVDIQPITMTSDLKGKAKATPPAAEASFYKYFLPFQVGESCSGALTGLTIEYRPLYATMTTSAEVYAAVLALTDYLRSGHLNNAVYVQYADSIINEYLTHHCALQAVGGTTPIGLIISSNFKYLAPLEYPAPLIAALSVTRCGIQTAPQPTPLIIPAVSVGQACAMG